MDPLSPFNHKKIFFIHHHDFAIYKIQTNLLFILREKFLFNNKTRGTSTVLGKWFYVNFTRIQFVCCRTRPLLNGLAVFTFRPSGQMILCRFKPGNV